MEELDIVDENDKIIGKCTRHESYKKCLTNRIIYVIIKGSHGKIALQKRSKTCSFMPGAWDATAGGHVESGQTYLEAAHREMYEEIGIKTELKFLGKTLGDRLVLDTKYEIKGFRPREKSHKFFRETYEGVYEGTFSFDDGEVDTVEWFSVKELKEMFDSKDSYMTPGLKDTLKQYYL